MSTLAEIKAAAADLPLPEKRSLLDWLEGQVRGTGESAPNSAPSASWLEELAALRLSLATGNPGADLQEILDDLRGRR
jgi:hypothetical protein